MIPIDLLATVLTFPHELFLVLAQSRFDFEGQTGLLGVIIVVLDIFAIVSVLMGRGSAGHKLLWILMILLLPVVGMILYFLFGRSPKDAKLAP